MVYTIYNSFFHYNLDVYIRDITTNMITMITLMIKSLLNVPPYIKHVSEILKILIRHSLTTKLKTTRHAQLR